MKYRSVNSLHDFHFHDAFWEFKSFKSGVLTLNARFLNIFRDAKENPADRDMEIQRARISFTGFSVDGYTSEDESLSGAEAAERFMELLKCNITVMFFTKIESGAWKIECSGGEVLYCEALLAFDNAVVEWDEFRGPAWYVK